MYPRPRRLMIPQYTAPANLSLVAAGELLGEGRRAMAAQIVDLAVRAVIEVSRPAKKPTRRSGFTLTIARYPSDVGEDERDVLTAMFDRVEVGQRLLVGRRQNRALGERLRDPHRLIVGRLRQRGLARKRNLLVKLLLPWRKQPVVPTLAAASTVDHLWGLRDYIALAERHRLAMLQSPEGAQLTASNVLVLNQRLLPYAVLFGLEKQWARELDVAAHNLEHGLANLDVGGPALDALDLNLDLDPGALASMSDVSALLDGLPDLADLPEGFSL